MEVLFFVKKETIMYKSNRVRNQTFMKKMLASTLALTLATSPLFPIVEQTIVVEAM